MAVLSLHAVHGLSLVAVHGLLLQCLLESQSASSSERGLSSYSTQAQLLHDTWNVSGPGIKPIFLALEGRFSTTGPKQMLLIQSTKYKNFIYILIYMIYLIYTSDFLQHTISSILDAPK